MPERRVAPATDEALIEAVRRCDDEGRSEIYDSALGSSIKTLSDHRQRGPITDDLIQQAFEQVVTTLAPRIRSDGS